MTMESNTKNTSLSRFIFPSCSFEEEEIAPITTIYLHWLQKRREEREKRIKEMIEKRLDMKCREHEERWLEEKERIHHQEELSDCFSTVYIYEKN